MSHNSRPSRRSTVITSFVVAFLLTDITPPWWLAHFWPDWVAMALIYWCMMQPERLGVGTGGILGVLVDASRGGLLGQHALAFSTIAYLTLQTYRRIRVFSPWRQSITVFIFLLIEQILVFWVSGIIGYPPADAWYLAPAVGGMVLWPALFMALREEGQSF